MRETQVVDEPDCGTELMGGYLEANLKANIIVARNNADRQPSWIVTRTSPYKTSLAYEADFVEVKVDV